LPPAACKIIFADGDTPEECYEATQEALSVAVAVSDRRRVPP
jgi:hypothetical protein